MALHDAQRGGEPQAGALAQGLGGEEGVEDLVQDAGRNARAGIRDAQDHVGTGLASWIMLAKDSSSVTFSAPSVSWPPPVIASRALTHKFIST